jgi:hypothetical protein
MFSVACISISQTISNGSFTWHLDSLVNTVSTIAFFMAAVGVVLAIIKIAVERTKGQISSGSRALLVALAALVLVTAAPALFYHLTTHTANSIIKLHGGGPISYCK